MDIRRRFWNASLAGVGPKTGDVGFLSFMILAWEQTGGAFKRMVLLGQVVDTKSILVTFSLSSCPFPLLLLFLSPLFRVPV